MARAMTTDPYNSFRFKVVASKVGTVDPLGAPQAGFTTCSLPSQTTEVAEYKEGTMVFRRKFPGDTTFDDVTLGRGVSTANTEFWAWAEQVSSGREYRSDLIIHQFHRTDVTDQVDYSSLTAARQIKLHEAFPSNVKLGSDMDSTSAEISIQEITITVEKVTITNTKTA